MNGLNINPISDPEELRQAAALQQPTPGNDQVGQTASQPVPAQPAVEISEAPIEPVSIQEKVASVYPTPTHSSQLTTEAAKAMPPNVSDYVDAEKPYSYPVPVGVYIIASWGFALVAAAIIYLGLTLVLAFSRGSSLAGLTSAIPYLVTIGYVAIISVGLLKSSRLAYWGALLGFTGFLLWILYGFIKSFMMGVGVLYGASVFYTIAIIPTVVFCLVSIGALIYLTRPKVAGAFS